MSNIAICHTGVQTGGSFLAAGLAAFLSSVPMQVRSMEPAQPRVQKIAHETGFSGLKHVRVSSTESVVVDDLSMAVASAFQKLLASQVEVDPEIAQATAKGFWTMFEE